MIWVRKRFQSTTSSVLNSRTRAQGAFEMPTSVEAAVAEVVAFVMVAAMAEATLGFMQVKAANAKS